MQIFDNVNTIVRDDLAKTITKGSRLSMAAACFSIYAFDALKKQLEGIEELRFLFTSPTFLKEKEAKAKREFYIPRLNRERSLYGTEFELHLRNKLQQRAVARECAAWIRKRYGSSPSSRAARESGISSSSRRQVRRPSTSRCRASPPQISAASAALCGTGS